MAPAFEAAAAQLDPHLPLGKIDTEAEQGLAIRSIPSLVLLRKGREITRTAGAISLSALVQWARRASSSA
jgi:thioredoxin 2